MTVEEIVNFLVVFVVNKTSWRNTEVALSRWIEPAIIHVMYAWIGMDNERNCITEHLSVVLIPIYQFLLFSV